MHENASRLADAADADSPVSFLHLAIEVRPIQPPRAEAALRSGFSSMPHRVVHQREAFFVLLRFLFFASTNFIIITINLRGFGSAACRSNGMKGNFSIRGSVFVLRTIAVSSESFLSSIVESLTYFVARVLRLAASLVTGTVPACFVMPALLSAVLCELLRDL